MLGPWYDLVWTCIAGLGLVLLVYSLFIWGRVKSESMGKSVLWLLVILLLPIVGPLAFIASVKVPSRRTAGRGD